MDDDKYTAMLMATLIAVVLVVTGIACALFGVLGLLVGLICVWIIDYYIQTM